MMNCDVLASQAVYVLFPSYSNFSGHPKTEFMEIKITFERTRSLFETCKVFDYQYRHFCVIMHFLISGTLLHCAPQKTSTFLFFK